jgi:hypothetical protein
MRKLLLVSSIAFIVLFGVLQLFIYFNQPVPLDELRKRAAVLPSLDLVTPDGAPHRLEEGRPIVLVYFNTTCDHCQRQVEWLRSEFSRFEGISVVLMSSQPLEEVREFSRSAFADDQEVTIVKVRHEEIAEKFGVLALPQIFVYDRELRLVELFAGETEPARISRAVR